VQLPYLRREPRAIEDPISISHPLNAMKLPEWGNLRDALSTRFSQALAAAAALLEPTARHFKLAVGTMKDEVDLKNWLKGVESQIRVKLQDGPVIL
jgi:hypothetical protein